jgi:hypothetical protein
MASLPVASTSSILLGLLGVLTNMATLSKVLGEVLVRGGSAISNALVVTVVALVRSGHYGSR